VARAGPRATKLPEPHGFRRPTHAVERGDELFGVKSIAVVDIDRTRPNIKA
jgi:hypothetical protein